VYVCVCVCVCVCHCDLEWVLKIEFLFVVTVVN